MQTTTQKKRGALADAPTNNTSVHSNPDECPRFHWCNANVCPLDDHWNRRKMLPDDTVCMYLMEGAKEGAEARFKRVGLENIYRLVVRLSPNISAHFPRIEAAIKRAALYGSRMERTFKEKKEGGYSNA